MSVALKKIDLLIRDNSHATQYQIEAFLKNIFAQMEKENNEKRKIFGYAAVFDARTSEYYLYYSDEAVKFFNMTRNRYDLIPKGVLTKNNFLSFFKEKLNEITALIFSKLKLVTEDIKVKEDKKAYLSYKALGSLVFDTAEVQKGEYIESFIVSLENGKIVSGFTADEIGERIRVTYLAQVD